MKKFNNKPNECVTTTDGRKVWLSRSVAVVGVFIAYCEKSKSFYVLIEKRGNNPGFDKPGLWCLPCGYLDYNETGIEAIEREAWEEVGFDIKKYPVYFRSNKISDQPWHVKTDPSENRQNVTLYYGCIFHVDKLEDIEIHPNNDCEPNEVADAKWVNIGALFLPNFIELNTYEFAFSHDEVIKKYLNYIKTINY